MKSRSQRNPGSECLDDVTPSAEQVARVNAGATLVLTAEQMATWLGDTSPTRDARSAMLRAARAAGFKFVEAAGKKYSA